MLMPFRWFCGENPSSTKRKRAHSNALPRGRQAEKIRQIERAQAGTFLFSLDLYYELAVRGIG